jgi:hypothetical protein
MKVTTDIKGDAEVAKLLKVLEKDILQDRHLVKTLKVLARPLIGSIKKKISSAGLIDTGNLKKSIGVIKKIKYRRGSPFILIGPRYYKPYKGQHAHFHEIGKKEYNVPWEANEFIKKSFKQHRNQIGEGIKKVMINELTKAANRHLKKITK